MIKYDKQYNGEKIMISFIAAMDREALPLAEKMKKTQIIKENKKTFYRGEIFGKEAVIAVSGIGKVNAALTAQIIINKYSPDYMINFGAVGGLDGSISALSYYCVHESCQYDFDLSDVDDVERGYIQDYDKVFFPSEIKGAEFLQKVRLATADKFTHKARDVKTVLKMGCKICDMEGAAISQVCFSSSLPLYIIKGVSDVYGSGIQYEQFRNNLNCVVKGFPDIIEKIIKNK